MNKELLQLAYDRFQNKNQFKDKDYELSIEEFIVKMYLNCDPASYGRQFVKKIMRDCLSTRSKKELNLYYVKDWVDQGDLVQTFPSTEFFTGKLYDNKKKKFIKWEEAQKTTFEVKISYLTKSGVYNIRNIRPYQNFDYYLLCFVDCKIDFKPEFILVKKSLITTDKFFKLTPMNGTKNANKNNVDIGYGTSFKRSGWQEVMLLSENILEGTSYEDFMNFLTTNVKSLEKMYV